MMIDASDEQAAVDAAVGNEQATNDQVVGDVGGGACAVVGLEGVIVESPEPSLASHMLATVEESDQESESQHTALAHTALEGVPQ